MSTIKRHLSHATARWPALLTVVLGAWCTGTFAAPGGGSDVLARSIALYPTLKSYADTGTVVKDAGGNWERYKFRTYFRPAERDLYFDFQGLQWKSGALIADMTDERRVFWMNKGELQTFDQRTRLHETIPAERQVSSLKSAGARTYGASILIPALIYPKTNLPSTVLQIQEATDAGFETIGGRRCHKVVGMAAAYYPSGQITNVRPVTVWIDAETLLIRKVFEDSPKGSAPGTVYRVTVTLDPQANPAIDDRKFQFTVPTFQQ